MAVNLSPYGGVGAQFLDNSGNVLTGGKIFTYAAGTTTNQVTYTTSAGNIPHSNPIILDASGRVPSGGEIWLTDGSSYKFILRDSNDVLIATYDNVTGINSNFVAFTNQQEIQTATAGQTVFNLTTMTYSPGTNSLTVFVDGVNQYGPGAQYAYLETDNDTITFVNGLHVGAEVKFTTSQLNSSGLQANAFQVSYTPPFTGSVVTNVGDTLAQTVSVMDFGADSTGVLDSSVAFQAAVDTGKAVFVPKGNYLLSFTVQLNTEGQIIYGEGPTITTIVTPTAAPAFLIEDIRLNKISDMLIVAGGASGIGIQLGTRGVNPGGAGAVFAAQTYLSNIRFVAGTGILAYGMNTGRFDKLFFEACTLGINFQPVGLGNVNGNEMTGITFYGCVANFKMNTNLDAGSNCVENNMSGGFEATSGGELFFVRGYANTFNLWVDTNSGAGPNISNADANYYVYRDAQNTPITYDNVSEIIRFRGGILEHSVSWFAKPARLPMTATFLASSISTSLTYGMGDQAVLVIENDLGVLTPLYLNCFADVPIGFKLTLVTSANTFGWGMYVPTSGGPWTTIGWTTGDFFLNNVPIGTSVTFVKIAASVIVRVI